MSFEFFQRLIELIPSIVYVYDLRDRKISYFNHHGAKMLGFGPHEVIDPVDFQKIILPDFLPLVHASQKRLCMAPQGAWERLELQVKHRSGRLLWLCLERTVFERDDAGEPCLILGIANDITEKKEAEERLHQKSMTEMEQQKRLLSDLLNALPDPIFVKDRLHRWIFLNTAFGTVLGGPPEQFLGKSDFDFFPKEMAEGFWERDEEVFESGQVNVTEELLSNSSDRLRTIVTTKASCRNTDGSEVLIGIIRDVTEKREKELLIEKSEAQFREAQRIGQIGSWEMEFPSRRTNWSPESFKIFGRDPALGAPTYDEFLQMVHPLDLPMMLKPLEESDNGPFNWEFEIRILRPSGEIRYLSERIEVERKDGQVFRLRGVATDITERRAIEEVVEAQRLKIVSSSKMSALGEMSAGLAHEINNPLAIIHGKACQLGDLARAGKTDPCLVEQYANKIEQTAMRIARIVRGLCTFARDADADPTQSVLVRSILEDTLDLCRLKFIHHDIAIEIGDFPADLHVECRPVQISQVLLNLLNNAFDAVENDPQKRWIQINASVRGLWIEISITDSGRGISPEVRQKIMQPFFTTKEIGRGTGLGLSISKGIIERHGGYLELDLQATHTRFVINLPVLQASKCPA